MKVFVGGVAAAFLGFLGIIIWYDAVFDVIGGAIPLILLLGGLMAAYLGYDEVKDKLPFPKGKESHGTRKRCQAERGSRKIQTGSRKTQKRTGQEQDQLEATLVS